MANIKSQIKRVKTNAKRTERNRAHKSELRTWMRKFHQAADTGDAATTQAALQTASRKLDKAVSKGVLHKNTASRKVSRLAARVRSLSA